MIREKNGVLNATGIWGNYDSPPHAEDQENMIFTAQNRLAYCLFTSPEKSSAVWGTFL